MTHRPKLIKQLTKPEIVDLKAHYEQAYEQAIYEVFSGRETIQLQIGKCCPSLDFLIIQIVQGDYPKGVTSGFALHSSKNCHSWAIITAYNPYSQISAKLENQLRHHKLMEHLLKSKLFWLEALGRDQLGIWTPEPSFWIFGIERVEAIAIGRQFEQNAIVYGELHQPAELQWL
jgi:hypothetical protein